MSPDRTLLAYEKVVFDSSNKIIEDNLVIADSNEQQIEEIPWEKDWFEIGGWLNNQLLGLGVKTNERLPPQATPLLAFNPFTKTQWVLKPNYPGIYNDYPPEDWGAVWGVSMYDPSLTRVVYLSMEHGQFKKILWNMQKHEILARIDGRLIPRWSPDGSHVVSEGLPEGEELIAGIHEPFETFLISQDGQIEQMTNLVPFTHARLMGYSWSPDGHYIAAWLGDPTSRGNGIAELVTIDVATKQITDYCIRGRYSGEGYGSNPSTPIWSPNGEQLLVSDWYEKYHRRVILVDLKQRFATQIAQDMEPVGWMSSSP